MGNTKFTAQCEFEDVSAADVLDGLGTLAGRSGQGVIIPPPGNGPDYPLAWAIQEVSNALHVPGRQEKAQFCTNAVINSRRALGCLVEWYIQRDLGNYCKNPPGTPKQQADFLMRRGIIDQLTARVLERAVDKRNRVEHHYIAADLDTAEDVVELLRRTMAAIRNQSDPSLAPWLFGVVLGGYGHGKRGRYAEFRGWSEPLTVFSRFAPRPWVGLVLPDGEARALVRREYLDNTTVEELIQLLALVEQKYGHPSSFMDLASCELMGRAIGLVAQS